jgi:nucleoside-diphosphate-sugar epimerase
MRIVVLGANGGTGRRLVQQALNAGHQVRAVTRHPQSFPIRGAGLEVLAADVRVDAPLAGADVVLSAPGVPFTKDPVTLYSRSTATVLAAMRHAGIRRLVVVSSSATDPRPHAESGIVLNRVIQPLVAATACWPRPPTPRGSAGRLRSPRRRASPPYGRSCAAKPSGSRS